MVSRLEKKRQGKIMTAFNLASLDPAHVQELSGRDHKERKLKPLGLTLVRLPPWSRFIDGEQVNNIVCYVVDSATHLRQNFHDVELWQVGDVWWGECDRELAEDDPFACKANKLGGLLCRHLARCIVDHMEHEPELQLLVQSAPNQANLEQDRSDVFGPQQEGVDKG